MHPAVKYLGLLAFSKILKTHPKSVQAHKDLVLQCLDDKDESIRMRALDLLYGMVRVQPISLSRTKVLIVGSRAHDEKLILLITFSLIKRIN